MRWSDRQLALLEAMGVRLWWPSAAAPEAAVVDAPVVALAPVEPVERVERIERVERVERVERIERVERVERVAPPAAAPSAVAEMDWPALRETVAGCTACRLCESRRQTVFGVGHPRARWMVVGEAPGEQEDRDGEPFVGKSGQLLDNMLRAIGVSRAAPAGADDDPARQVYIANTVKCRPPGNRNPAPDELAQCEAYLVRQVELVQPRIILAMGRFAVQTLLRSSEPVGRLRGRVHRYHGLPLVVTYHPAYLLRNLEDKAKAWDDLCLAVETVAAEVAG